MDSLTHIVIGAIIGEAYAGKSIGKKALVLGALFQSIPDIDFISSFFVSPSASLLAHRGFTHSLLFIIIVSLVFSFAAHKWFKKIHLTFMSWAGFIALELVVHITLDSLNIYGVGWLEPFSPQRFSFHSLFVIDPFYSVILFIAFVVLIFYRTTYHYRFVWALGSLTISCLYISLSFFNQVLVNHRLESALITQNISSQRYFATPTEFNIFLWYCVVEVDSGYYVGFSSVFDKEQFIQFYFFLRNENRTVELSDRLELANLIRFSKGYYTIDRIEGELVFNDLRFGREAGWQHDQAAFTFHYYLQQPSKNIGRLQRGRWSQLNRSSLEALVQRIKGN
ncbi:MAG: metal-dependent hydrolase [Bacteroidetes bacterium]|nr:metal-dependent hydrolase [Bacteroidota bacterium]